MNKILHLSTGGTIDGHVPEYPEVSKAKSVFGDVSNLDNYILGTFKIAANYSSESICSKDSRDITDQDRLELVNRINDSFSNKGIDKFLITHGTFTMPDTGVFLLNNLKPEVLSKVSIVITGSMFPLGLIGSDASLNVGASISSLLNTEAILGVVVSMHGKNWDPRKIEKDADGLVFGEKRNQ